MTDRPDEWRRTAAANPREGACWRCGQTRRVVQIFTVEVRKDAPPRPDEPIPGRDLCFRCYLEMR